MSRRLHSISDISHRLPKWTRAALIAVLVALLGLATYLMGSAWVLANGSVSQGSPGSMDDGYVTGYTFTLESGPVDTAPDTVKEAASELIAEHQILQEKLNELQPKTPADR